MPNIDITTMTNFLNLMFPIFLGVCAIYFGLKMRQDRLLMNKQIKQLDRIIEVLEANL